MDNLSYNKLDSDIRRRGETERKRISIAMSGGKVEEIIARLEEENRVQRKIIEELTKINSELNKRNSELREKINHLEHTLSILKKQIFGPKSERIISSPSDTPDLTGFERSCIPEEEKEEEKTEVRSHIRKKGKTINKESFTINLPGDLPRKDRIIDIPEEEKYDPETGEELVKIGEDVTEQLAYKPGEYFVLRTIRPKYASRRNSLMGVKQAKAPSSILTGSKLDVSAMAEIIIEKFAYHMPLNRQLEKFRSYGIYISAQYLSSLVINLGEKLSPLIEVFEKEAFKRNILFTDETPVKVKLDNKGKCKQGHVWIYYSPGEDNNPIFIYKFTESRSSNVPFNHLRNFKGVIHGDAFDGYVKLDSDINYDIRWAACWVHARRYFIQSNSQGKIESHVLKIMRWLFRWERLAWKHPPDIRLQIRQKKELPLVNKLFDSLKHHVRQGAILPSSPLAKAIGYMLAHEKNFRLYLSDPNIRMDNNSSERALRKLVIGRNNWLFFGSIKSADSAMGIISLIQTCRAMNIDLHAYFSDIFTNLLDAPAKTIRNFIPYNWIKIHPEYKNLNAHEK